MNDRPIRKTPDYRDTRGLDNGRVNAPRRRLLRLVMRIPCRNSGAGERFFCRASSSWDVGCLRLGNHVTHPMLAQMPR